MSSAIGVSRPEVHSAVPARRGHRFDRRVRFAYLLFAPTLLLVLLVTLVPVVYALALSVLRTDYLNIVGFAGLAQYGQFLADSMGRQDVVASVVYVLGSLTLAVPLGLALALVLNRSFRFRAFFRTILVLPWVTTLVAAGLLWNWLYNPQYGPLDYLLQQTFGITIDFLGQPLWAMLSMIVTNVWQSYPYAMILTLAGLQTISEDVLEAAAMDGASNWQQFWRVKVPLIQNHLLVVIVLLGINYFNQVTLPLVLTGGGPVNATYVMGLRVYNEAFAFYHMGFASAIAVYMLVFNLIFTLIYLRVLRREEAV